LLIEESGLRSWFGIGSGGCGNFIIPDGGVDNKSLKNCFRLGDQAALLQGPGCRDGGEEERSEDGGSLHGELMFGDWVNSGAVIAKWRSKRVSVGI
jgi:hypothetical protein